MARRRGSGKWWLGPCAACRLVGVGQRSADKKRQTGQMDKRTSFRAGRRAARPCRSLAACRTRSRHEQ
jgi:hypothetical protein